MALPVGVRIRLNQLPGVNRPIGADDKGRRIGCGRRKRIALSVNFGNLPRLSRSPEGWPPPPIQVALDAIDGQMEGKGPIGSKYDTRPKTMAGSCTLPSSSLRTSEVIHKPTATTASTDAIRVPRRAAFLFRDLRDLPHLIGLAIELPGREASELSISRLAAGGEGASLPSSPGVEKLSSQ